MRRHYPAIARRFPVLANLESVAASKEEGAGGHVANQIRTEAYQSLYDKLPTREKAFVDRLTKKMLNMRGLGNQGAWELIIAVAQAMVWLDWPKDSPRKENKTNGKSHIY